MSERDPEMFDARVRELRRKWSKIPTRMRVVVREATTGYLWLMPLAATIPGESTSVEFVEGFPVSKRHGPMLRSVLRQRAQEGPLLRPTFVEAIGLDKLLRQEFGVQEGRASGFADEVRREVEVMLAEQTLRRLEVAMPHPQGASVRDQWNLLLPDVITDELMDDVDLRTVPGFVAMAEPHLQNAARAEIARMEQRLGLKEAARIRLLLRADALQAQTGHEWRGASDDYIVALDVQRQAELLGVRPADVLRGYRSQERFTPGYIREVLADARTAVVNRMVEASEETRRQAVAEFLDVLRQTDPSTFNRLKKLKLPLEPMVALAVAFLSDPATGMLTVREAVGDFGYEGSRGELLLEVDAATLQGLGIARGTRWMDGAPWRLINLPTSELAYEGVLQRHCIGRPDLSYRRRVHDGEIFAWSLRSRFNQPILTWAVDASKWLDARSDYQRGDAVFELRGKLNREPPGSVDEDKVLRWVFGQLRIDPSAVRNYKPHNLVERNPEWDWGDAW
jgi:hypothetical protein